MKNKLHLASFCLIIILGLSSCSKEEPNSVRAKILGKWRVEQISTTTDGETTTVNYGPTDYIEFRNSENDDLEVSLNGVKTVGSFSSGIDNDFFMDLTSKDLRCKVVEITASRFKFNAVREGSSSQPGTEVYILSR